jgi:hypothetical protein
VTIAEQRAAFAAIGLALQTLALEDPLDWRAARRLHHALGEALRTDAQTQKRQRYLTRRAQRKLQRLAAGDPIAGEGTEGSTRA